MKKSYKILSVVALSCMLTACANNMEKHSVYFKSGSDKLSMEDKKSLRKLAEDISMKDAKLGYTAHLNEKLYVSLKGHTDNVGKMDLNKKLAEKRVNVVKAELVKLGVKSAQISTVAKGEGCVEKDGKSDHTKRRVDIVVK